MLAAKLARWESFTEFLQSVFERSLGVDIKHDGKLEGKKEEITDAVIELRSVPSDFF